jgi:hypothetical protein
MPTLGEVFAGVVEHIDESTADLRRCAKRARVVAVGEDGAGAAAHHAVEALGHADAHALKGAAEGTRVHRLDEHVDVVVLDGKVGQPRIELAGGHPERAFEDAEAAPAAELPDFGAHAERDMERKPRVDAAG